MALILPTLKAMTLRAFSLYDVQDPLLINFTKPATCLVGANGMGKSTFIACITYALTGTVPKPLQSIDSLSEYRTVAQKYAADFFTGRIHERDRDRAEVTLEFCVGTVEVAVTRGFFAPDAVRHLRINQSEIAAATSEAQRALCATYETEMVQATGLVSFPQFIFLNSFVLAFNESRHLLFWDDFALTQALFPFFDILPETWKTAADLYEQISDADSRARNARWHASQLRKKLADVEDVLQSATLSADIADLQERYQSAQDRVAVLAEELSIREQALSDARIAQSNTVGQLQSARHRYEELFSTFLTGDQLQSVVHHPIVDSVLRGQPCPICNAVDTHRVREAVERRVCPLCGNQLTPGRGADFSELEGIDRLLTQLQGTLAEQTDLVRRLQAEAMALRNDVTTNERECRSIEASPEWIKAKVASPSSPFDMQSIYRQQIDEFNSEADAHFRVRQELTTRARTLQKDLAERYRLAESDFVPLFNALADLFTGLHLDIHMQEMGTMRPLLRFELEVDTEHRYFAYQLSESQRFFIDIALRMALLNYLNRNGDRGGFLLVDTPEGSLDIAYETNAGQMFATFVDQPMQLIMTANINTSGLIREFARRCSESRLSIVRMTNWAHFSAVQAQHEDLFDNAYKEIMAALGKAEGTT